MDAKDGTVLGRIIARRFGFDEAVAEDIAQDMIGDDFPKNGIKTMAEAIRYIENIPRRTDEDYGKYLAGVGDPRD
jgi:hypothetical protein